jgi:4-cresol dehydrogenase (hydroxylating)
MTKRIHEKYGFDYFPTFYVGWREMHHIVIILYNRKDQDQRRAHVMMKELVAEGAKMGMGEYGTHLALQDQVTNTYNYNMGLYSNSITD